MYCSTLTGNIIGAKREKERDSDKDKQRQGQQRRYKERGKKSESGKKYKLISLHLLGRRSPPFFTLFDCHCEEIVIVIGKPN